MSHNRREFLALAAKVSALALSAPLAEGLTGLLPAATAKVRPSGVYGLLRPTGPITLTARSVTQLVPATGAAMLAYQAEQGGKTFHNPVLVLDSGQEFRARMVNALSGPHAAPTIIHWHGLDGDWRQAGHPSYAVPPGAHYDYAFTVTNRAGTYWYHPHPHGFTARQSYLGLASLFLVRDAEERALAKELDLELGVTDLPVTLQDKRLSAAGEFLYAPTADDLVMGYLGDEVLANGARRPVIEASSRIYRLRLHNGCTARIFNLTLQSGGRMLPFMLIANDGGLLESAQELTAAFLAPGERVEILVDLRGVEPGQSVALANAGFDPMHREHAGHSPAPDPHAGHGKAPDPHAGHGAASAPARAPLEEGAAYPILSLKVVRRERYERKVPSRLSTLPTPSGPLEPGPARRFELAFDRANGRWTIAGLTFDMDAAPVVVDRRTPQAWELIGAPDGMPHPMHLHGYFFRVLSRRGSPEQVARRAVDGKGRTALDLGLKDTVLVWPGETVAIAPDFGRPDYPGEQLFLLHCHNLEHEDQGMMLNVRVK